MQKSCLRHFNAKHALTALSLVTVVVGLYETCHALATGWVAASFAANSFQKALHIATTTLLTSFEIVSTGGQFLKLAIVALVAAFTGGFGGALAQTLRPLFNPHSLMDTAANRLQTRRAVPRCATTGGRQQSAIPEQALYQPYEQALWTGIDSRLASLIKTESLRASLTKTVEEARANTDGSPTLYTGMVMQVTEEKVIQHVGMSQHVSHDLKVINHPVAAGDLISVYYSAKEVRSQLIATRDQVAKAEQPGLPPLPLDTGRKTMAESTRTPSPQRQF